VDVKLLKYTEKPEQSITLAAKICYSADSLDKISEKITKESAYKFVRMLKSLGHESALEHVSFTFGIEGMSRAATHQLVRHRLASFSQQSQRYVSMGNASFVIPPSIEKNKAALKIYRECIEKVEKTYSELTDMSILPEDARYILPNACESNIVVTMNARELLHFFTLRCCQRAQWEIRYTSEKMLNLAKEVAPVVFENSGPECVRTSCTEGKMTCGKSRKMKEKYRS